MSIVLMMAAILATAGCDDCPDHHQEVHVVQPDEGLALLLASCFPSNSDAGFVSPLGSHADAGALPPSCLEVCERIYRLAVEMPMPARLQSCSLNRNRDAATTIAITFTALCR
ncbi:MAG TPA: hypothetical protein VGG33_07160 [Polyangia bacterium]